MERLSGLGAMTVRGNHDRQVATLHPSDMNASDRFAFDQLTPDQRKRLGSLPAALTVVPGVMAFHASPRCDDAYLAEEVQDAAWCEGRCRASRTGSAL